MPCPPFGIFKPELAKIKFYFYRILNCRRFTQNKKNRKDNTKENNIPERLFIIISLHHPSTFTVAIFPNIKIRVKNPH